MVVRAEGFEPTSLAALEPKSSASASSATPAKGSGPKPDTPGRRGLYHAFPAAHHKKWLTEKRRHLRLSGATRSPGVALPSRPRYHGKTMRSAGWFVSRRSLVRGTGTAVGAALLALPLSAQPGAFRTITARTGVANLRSGNAGPTPIRGFEGTAPGPTLRGKRGEELRVRLINELVTDMTVHWHGVRLPKAMDGIAGLIQAAVAPGESFDYRFIPPDAGTFWYYAPSRFLEDRALYGLQIGR